MLISFNDLFPTGPLLFSRFPPFVLLFLASKLRLYPPADLTLFVDGVNVGWVKVRVLAGLIPKGQRVKLGGGFKDFLFSPLLGEDLQFD